MPTKDPLGDRMKLYESMTCNSKFMPRLPIVVRLDGKAFTTFTQGMDKPFDHYLATCMNWVTKYLCEYTNSKIGYTQSDEITLILYSQDFKTKVFFDGKIQKIISVLASVCSVKFNEFVQQLIPEHKHKMPVFDCRAFTVPNKVEACNVLLWREQDATRNSIQNLARSVFSDKQCFKKNTKILQEMLFQKSNVNWNSYPARFKRGQYVQRVTKNIPFTSEEIERLPPNHDARKNPGLLIERSVFEFIELPKFSSITNKEDVVFNGMKPEIDTQM